MRKSFISFTVASSVSATLLAPALGARAVSPTSVPEADVCEAILETFEQDVAGAVPDELSTFADIIASAPETAIQSAESPGTLFIPANLAFNEIRPTCSTRSSPTRLCSRRYSTTTSSLAPRCPAPTSPHRVQRSRPRAVRCRSSSTGDTLAINGGAATVLCSDISKTAT